MMQFRISKKIYVYIYIYRQYLLLAAKPDICHYLSLSLSGTLCRITLQLLFSKGVCLWFPCELFFASMTELQHILRVHPEVFNITCLAFPKKFLLSSYGDSNLENQYNICLIYVYTLVNTNIHIIYRYT